MDAEQDGKKYQINMNDHEGETHYQADAKEAQRLLDVCKDAIAADMNRLPDIQSVMCLITTKDNVIHHGSGTRNELVDAIATEMVKSRSFGELIASATLRAIEITILGEDKDDDAEGDQHGDVTQL